MQTLLNSKVARRKLFTISAAAKIVDVNVDSSASVDASSTALVSVQVWVRACVCASWRSDFSPALVGCASRQASACFFRDLHSSNRGCGSGRGRGSSRTSGSSRGCVTSSSFRLSGATTRQLHKNATTQNNPLPPTYRSNHHPLPAFPSPLRIAPLSHMLPYAALLCSFVPHSRVYEKLLKLLNKWIIGCLLAEGQHRVEWREGELEWASGRCRAKLGKTIWRCAINNILWLSSAICGKQNG